jgi:hypothetical protein
MPCSLAKDCLPLECNKRGSSLLCEPGGCVCTLPVSKKVSGYLIVCLIMCLLLWTMRPKRPDFIQTTTFSGYRNGYVFKTKNGKTGYYKEI